MPLADLKEAAGLSNKAWDKSLKGLNKLGLTKVVKEDDTLICKLNE
jgi:lysyl-tRNA synthetase class 2